MANGDELILGELGNAATSTTRLVGDVEGNAVLWIEQQSETNAGEAIVALGGPGRTAIFGFGGNSNTGRGGLAIAGQGEMAFHTTSVALACWAVGAVQAATAGMAYGGLRDRRARLGYSGSISVSDPVCEGIAPSRPRGSAPNRQGMVSGQGKSGGKAYTARRVRARASGCSPGTPAVVERWR